MVPRRRSDELGMPLVHSPDTSRVHGCAVCALGIKGRT